MSPASSLQTHSPRIGVVLPYFQQESGLLQRALAAVAAQEYPAAQVVVVDDGAPRPACEEISPALRAALPGLTLLRQVNRGVAAARNAALAALRADVTAIALLDSDDYWMPQHLQRAATALARGADFFFANSVREGEAARRFDEHPRLRPADAESDNDPELIRWQGTVSELMGAACPFATPTVVYQRALNPQFRFSQNFRRAGEDQAGFWDLLVRAAVIMYTPEATLVIGSQGMGTWRNATFGTTAHLVRLADEIQLRRYLIGNYPLRAHDRREMHDAVTARRYAALYSALHLLRRRSPGTLAEIAYLFRADPPCLAAWCLGLPTLLYRKLLGRPITTRWTG